MKKPHTIKYDFSKEETLFDPNGSYTGRCKDKNEIPTQDVDDL